MREDEIVSKRKIVIGLLVVLVAVIYVLNHQSIYMKEIYDKEWYFYDESRSENVKLSLSSDEIEVIAYDKEHLLLRTDGKIKDFVLEEFDANSAFYKNEAKRYLSGYNSRCIEAVIEGDQLLYAPLSFDLETDEKKALKEKYTLSEDIKYNLLTVRSFNSVGGEEYYDYEYSVVDEETLELMQGDTCFLWMNDELEVEKVVFYGQTTIEADFVSITVPKELGSSITQEKLDRDIDEGLYDVAKINEDGSIYYLYADFQKDEILKSMAKDNKKAIEKLQGNGIKEIRVNKDYSEFEIVLDDGYWELVDESKKQLEEMGKLYQWFKYSEDREVRISIVNN